MLMILLLFHMNLIDLSFPKHWDRINCCVSRIRGILWTLLNNYSIML